MTKWVSRKHGNHRSTWKINETVPISVEEQEKNSNEDRDSLDGESVEEEEDRAPDPPRCTRKMTSCSDLHAGILN